MIGDSGQLPWRLSADLQRFRRITNGHCLVMGRRTFESIGRLLPGRTTVVLTRQPDFRFPGALVAHSRSQVDLMTADDPMPMVVGGAEIYRLFWPGLRELFLTRVHTRSSGDTKLQPIDWAEWEPLASDPHPADARNQFAMTFWHYRRKSQG